MFMTIAVGIFLQRRYRWLRGLGGRSAADRLLKLWVRISPRAWMFVLSVVCRHVEVSATIRRLVQRISTECGESFCVT